jgi:hypothetical protein
MSVREDPTLYLQPGQGRVTAGTVMGGNATTSARPHKLDGPEHTAADDTTALDSSTTAHGLMWKLTGDAADVFTGVGWGSSAAALTILDEGVPLATAATSMDFVGDGVVASGAAGAKTITITEPAAATVAGDLAAPLADAAGAHDASAISLLDTGGLYTATDAEAALAEVMAAVQALGAAASFAYAPILVNNPALVTTDGEAVWVPWATVDGDAILGRVPV